MCPVYINRIASIHAESRNEKPYFSAQEPDYKEMITNANLRRRMSRMIKMGVACGLECLKDIPSEKVDAIITATGLGCLADTEKFMNALMDNREQMLNPTAFIQSTFNTVGAQIALLLKIHAYNVTYVHRGLSFESALIDGIISIAEGKQHVLAGAMDEITPTSHIIQQRLGLLKGTTAGEGAQFFLLSAQKEEQTFAELKGVDTFITRMSAPEISNRMHHFLKSHGLAPEDIDWFISGKNGQEATDAVYTDLEHSLFPHALHSNFKEQCGEYQTASSYALWMAAKALKEEASSRYALIYNQYQGINHSIILIKRCTS